MNVQSLGHDQTDHTMDVTTDHTLWGLCLTETGLHPGVAAPQIKGLKCYVASHGMGKGVAVYVKEGARLEDAPWRVEREAFQIVRLDFPDLILINV